VQDILASYDSTADTAEKTRAEDFLRKALAGGPRRTKEVEEEAKEIYGIAKRTLERARGKLRIPAAQRPTGEPRKKDGPRAIEWWIALPGHEGDLADVGPDCQHASACQGRRCGGVADHQTANGRSLTRHHDAPPAQTARPPTPRSLADCISSQTEASAPMSGSSATAASLRKPISGPKARPALTPTPPHDHDHDHHQGESR
jgi:hypothetical protein